MTDVLQEEEKKTAETEVGRLQYTEVRSAKLEDSFPR